MKEVKRVRYFDQEFLEAEDFNVEQNYHCDMRQMHNRDFHTWGIGSGLEVNYAPDQVTDQETKVTIHPGTALDNEGKEIVLAEPRIRDFGQDTYESGKSYYVTIKWEKVECPPRQEDECKRWLEEPVIDASKEDPPENPEITLVLAKITLKDDSMTIKTIDNSDRRYATLEVGDDTVTSAKIVKADGTSEQDTTQGEGIKTGHIQNNAITEPKIADDSVSSAKIKEADDTTNQDTAKGYGIKTGHIQDDAITSSKIKEADDNPDHGIKTAHIQDLAVTGDKIAKATINESKFDSATSKKLVSKGDNHNHSGLLGDTTTKIKHSDLVLKDGENVHKIGMSQLKDLTANGNVGVNGSMQSKLLTFYGSGSDSGVAPQSYAIYQEKGPWRHPYPDLVIAYHTGIKIGGHKNYEGTRFYNDAPQNSGATEIMSVGKGDNHTRVNYNLIVSGNVGIGTNPGEKLHVNGPIRGNISGALRISTGHGYMDVGPQNTSWAHFCTGNPGFYFNKEIVVDSGCIGTYNEDLQLRTSRTTRMTIRNDNGNVGIGILPTYKLQVQGNALFTGNYLFVNSENAGRLRVGAAWGMPGLYSGDDGARDLTLGVPSGRKVYLGVERGDAWVEGGSGNSYFKGNVGIGTTSLSSKFNVNGNIDMTGWNRRIYMGGTGGTTFGIAYDSFHPDFGIFYTEGSPDFVSISPNNNSRNGVMNILGDGKVGIGTPSPGAKLTINDMINTSSLLTYRGYGEQRIQDLSVQSDFSHPEPNDIMAMFRAFVGIKKETFISTPIEYKEFCDVILNHRYSKKVTPTYGIAYQELYHRAISIRKSYERITGGIIFGGSTQNEEVFYVDSGGGMCCKVLIGGTGDYAEYFESKDGKVIKPGTAVVLDGDKIKTAKKGEIPMGIVSANPLIVGGMPLEWPKKYLKDEFGNKIMDEYKEEIMVPKKEKVKKERQKVEKKKVKEKVKRTEIVKKKGKYFQVEVEETVERELEEPMFKEVDLYDDKTRKKIGKHKIPVMETYEEEIDVLDEKGKPVMIGSGKFETRTRPKINPEYDEKQTYITREERPEWNCVGLLGQLPLRKGQPTAPTWVKMKVISKDVELWLVK